MLTGRASTFQSQWAQGQKAHCPDKPRLCQDFRISSSKPHVGMKWKAGLFKYQKAEHGKDYYGVHRASDSPMAALPRPISEVWSSYASHKQSYAQL